MTEMANHVFGDFLTENPAVAQSAFGSHRVITDRWKGMSPEQIAEIKRIQEMQMKEAQVSQILHFANAGLNLTLRIVFEPSRLLRLRDRPFVEHAKFSKQPQESGCGLFCSKRKKRRLVMRRSGSVRCRNTRAPEWCWSARNSDANARCKNNWRKRTCIWVRNKRLATSTWKKKCTRTSRTPLTSCSGTQRLDNGSSSPLSNQICSRLVSFVVHLQNFSV